MTIDVDQRSRSCERCGRLLHRGLTPLTASRSDGTSALLCSPRCAEELAALTAAGGPRHHDGPVTEARGRR